MLKDECIGDDIYGNKMYIVYSFSVNPFPNPIHISAFGLFCDSQFQINDYLLI